MVNFHKKITKSEELKELKEDYLKLKTIIPNIANYLHRSQKAHYLGLLKEIPLSKKNLQLAINNVNIGLEKFVSEIEHPLFKLEGKLKPKGLVNPEGLWIYLLMFEGEDIARFGLNYHKEHGEIVASIVTVQGPRENVKKEKLIKLNKELGRGNYWPVEGVAGIIKSMGNEIKKVRGIPSTDHPMKEKKDFDKHLASNLYDRTFRNDKIGMYKVNKDCFGLNYYEKILNPLFRK